MRAVFVVAAAIGAAAVAVPAVAGATAGAGEPVADRAPQADQVTVQLNQDTAATQGKVGHFQRGDVNVALANCAGAKAGSATFSSPVLWFSDYSFGQFVDVKATMGAEAYLVSGTAAGQYPLTVTCGGKSSTTTFSVPAEQVGQVPDGAAKAGDGSLAE
ncbi:hypothetical protein ATK36_2478 [Amycolatopsis sulphurea]|uniref:Secreted protein n=1 Tax=Amycolatopsis sulphurea TaxID=76022 RepID=A0A2A9FAI3_9PSEU|nr:hypothetical protein ATK36_2478 [Amycolatopsis sulphurea]